MKPLHILPLAALSAAFVLPDQDVMNSEAVWNTESSFQKTTEQIPYAVTEAWGELDHTVTEALGCAKHHFTDAVDTILDKASQFGKSFEETFDHKSWLDYTGDAFDPSVQAVEYEDRPKHPKHPPHHHKPNQTVYELISKSKYTTILAKLISEYPDLVEALNGTAANYTVFAPTDKAFKKIPDHAPKPSKEDLKKILSYHVSPEFYPAGRVLVTRTIPTVYKSPALGDEPQRLSTQIGLRGLSVNFYSRIIAVDIFGTNGVIHGVDSILVPPPKVINILQFLVGDFSTLDLALEKTGLASYMNDTSLHVGGTVFAPTNFAFKKLGPKINAFLFSSYGEKYLSALIKYHLVPNFTLYSDALYKGDKDESSVSSSENQDLEVMGGSRIPKGRYHIDLPTGLHDKSLAIDIARWGRFIEVKINGYNRVSIPDGIAQDGVIHVVNSVLIPPKKPGLVSQDEEEDWKNMSVEEFKRRLEPYVPGFVLEREKDIEQEQGEQEMAMEL